MHIDPTNFSNAILQNGFFNKRLAAKGLFHYLSLDQQLTVIEWCSERQNITI